jgi:phosphocarrier protein HPr
VPTRQVTVASAVGLHARPASLFARAVQAHAVPVTIAKQGGTPVDAASLLMVMGLGVQHGETVELSSEAEGADAVLDELVAMLARDLDAE